MKRLKDNNGSKSASPRVDSTLSKGLRILEVLAESSTGKGVTEISRELDLTKSNTFRLLRSLTILGYVQPTESKNYQATLKIWQLGQLLIDHINLQEIAAPQLLHLSQQTGETVYLAVREGLNVVYIDKIDSSKPIRSWNPKGGSAPIHCVGTGKALLAADYEKLREQIRHNLTRYTPITITSIKALDADMAETSKRGYAIDNGEFRDRIHSFGAAIRLPNNEAIAALGVSVPDVNLEGNRENEICLAVCEAAAEVSKCLGRT